MELIAAVLCLLVLGSLMFWLARVEENLMQSVGARPRAIEVRGSVAR